MSDHSINIDALFGQIEKLKTDYEKHFQGLERLQPFRLRQEVESKVRTLASGSQQNTREKFKAEQVIAKFNTLKVYWDRTLREIEEGRYKRDKFLHKLKTNPEHSISKAPPKPKSAIEKLFDHYKIAKSKCKEDVGQMNLDAFKNNIKKQQAVLKEKMPGKKIAFKVVVEDGKAKVKAVVKKT